MSRPLLVVDGDSFAHRAYHALPKSIRRADGRPGNALVGFTNMLLHALQRSGAVRDVMADLVAGRQPYSTLKWRLLKTLELRLAARWILAS